jgi:uncharacterized membrane protein YgaE (UPF0421/DUF939 family)
LAEARARLLRGLVPGVQAGIASGAAWAVARALGHELPIFAPIAALVAIGATASGRSARSIELTLGVALGIFAGDFVRAGFGHTGWSIAIAVFLAIGFARLIDERPLMLTQAGISAVPAVVLDPRDGGLILTRLVDAVVGVAVAVVVAAVVLPPRPDKLTQQALARLRGSMSGVLDDCGRSLADLDRTRADRALDRARTLDEQVSALEETLDVARETLLFRPLRVSDRRRVAEIREAAPYIDLAVRNLRVLARAVGRLTRTGPRPPDDLLAALRELEAAVDALLRDEWALGRHALAAVALGGRASARRQELAVHALVAQVRSLAVDLLSASGVEPEAARSRGASAAPAPRAIECGRPLRSRGRVPSAEPAERQGRGVARVFRVPAGRSSGRVTRSAMTSRRAGAVGSWPA